MADAMTEDALATRINALSGGAPLPQSATQTIANRLLGPGIAERYGDVIGTRPYGAADIARDFSLGFISGDPLKAQQLKAQVMQNYRQELRREEDQAMQREAAAREQLNGFFQLMQQGKAVPKELRKDFFKEGLTKIGVEPTSPLFLNILSNYEKFGDIYDSLADPDVQRLADENPLAAVEQLIEMGHDGGKALQLVKNVQEMKRYRAETQKIIAQSARLTSLAQADPNTRARQSFIGRMLSQKRTDRLGRPRAVTAEEQAQIEAMADRLYPPTAATPVGIAQEEPAAPIPAAVSGETPVAPGSFAGSTPTTTSPESTATPAEPVGIAQTPAPKAAPSPAAETTLKVRRTASGNVATPVR